MSKECLPVGTYIVSLDDTWKGTTQLWHTDSLAHAKAKALRLVRVVKDGNVVISESVGGKVVDYVQKDWVE